ncbi:MAG: hypothetical protein R3C43_09715 [Chloroflexota bacterium]
MSTLVMTLSRSSGTSIEKRHSKSGNFSKSSVINRRNDSVVEGTKLALGNGRGALTESGSNLRYFHSIPQGTESDNIRLVIPLPTLLERDDDGTYILSEELFDRYGTGDSPQEAYNDLLQDLGVYYEIIAESATEDYPAALALFKQLQQYIQLI